MEKFKGRISALIVALSIPDMLADMLQPYPPGEMAYIAYAKAANRSAEKDEAKITPAEGAVEVRG